MPYTLFALGTGQAIANNNSIVHAFHNAVKGPKCLLDGPSALDLDEKIESNVVEGVRNLLRWMRTSVIPADGKYRINMMGYSRGAIICLRIANRLKSIATSLRDANNQPISLDQLELNIFGHEPVAGPGDKSDAEARDVPSIVKNYKFTIATGERRSVFFTPTEYSRLGEIDFWKTNVQALPLPGVHWTTTVKQPDKINHATKLAWYHSFDFLTEHGTCFRNNAVPHLVDHAGRKYPISREDKHSDTSKKKYHLLKLYTDAKAHEQDYIKAGKRWEFTHILVKRKRTFVHHLEDYVADPDFFFNQAHRNLFKKCYPMTFKHLFETQFEEFNEEIISELRRQTPDYIRWLKTLKFCINNESKSAEPSFVTNDHSFRLRTISERCPKLRRYLNKQAFYFNSIRNELLSMSQNVEGLYESLTVRGVRNQLHGVEFPLFPTGRPRVDADISDYRGHPADSPEILYREARQIIYNYRRVKSENRFLNELMAYTSRDEAPRVNQMLKQLKKIISSPINDLEKRKKLLNCLQQHYKKLVQCGSSSKLRKRFLATLHRYGCEYKEVHAGRLAWCVAMVGSLFKMIGKVVRILGQAGSSGGGVVGDIVNATGRFFTNRSPWLFGMKYWLGYPLRALGVSIKRLSKILEYIGNGIRKVSKKLVDFSGRHTVIVIRDSSTLVEPPTSLLGNPMRELFVGTAESKSKGSVPASIALPPSAQYHPAQFRPDNLVPQKAISTTSSSNGNRLVPK